MVGRELAGNGEPMHILFLSDNFPPEVNAPASRTHEHCRLWASAGHRVTVVTCAPNFPKGKVFDGYRNAWRQEEVVDGIRVIRVWSYITANEGFARRILDYLSYMATATLAGLGVRDVDLVVGTSPQFFTACAAHMVASLKRRPWVFELRDLWPESIKAVGAMRESAAIRLLERIELHLYRRAARVVSLTHSFKRNLVERGIDGSKIDVVTNGVDIARFTPRPRDPELGRRFGLDGKFVAGYIGTHGMAHALETLLDAAERLRRLPEGADIRILFLGDGAKKAELVADAQERALSNVVFVDSVPKDEVPRYWSLLDASVIHLRRSELFKTVIPSKLFESMGMGIPIVLGVEGETADIVRREQVGEVFVPEDADALVAALLRLKSDASLRHVYRRNCLAGSKKYDRDTLARVMLDILEATAMQR